MVRTRPEKARAAPLRADVAVQERVVQRALFQPGFATPEVWPKVTIMPDLRLAAYQPDIAQNLGAMIRLSACFDTPLDIIEPCGFPLSIKALRRTAMDYADVADLTRHIDWGAFRTTCRGRVVLLTTAGDAALWDFGFQPGDTLLMGRETAGVPDDVHASVDARVVIPITDATRSLNLATAAAIALAEALRQLRAT